jgi:tetratricopeptide (TPR) repeat protein
MKNLLTKAFLLGLSIACPLVLRADDFQGAGALLTKLSQPPAPSATSSPAATGDSMTKFAEDLASFTTRASGQAPEDAARHWLALFDRARSLQKSGNQMGGLSSVSRATFSALPGPAAWPALARLIKDRAANGKDDSPDSNALGLIADTLANSEDQQWTDLAKLAGAQQGSAFLSLGSALSQVANHPDEVEKFWETASFDKGAQSANPVYSYRSNEVELPDLVTILGKDKAAPIILRALLAPSPVITKIMGIETQALARELALAQVDKLQVAPWYLTQSLDGADLYEALHKKFPDDDGGRQSTIYYVISLVAHGRSEEAAKVDHDIDLSQLEEATAELVEAGWSSQVYDYIHAYLGQHPDSDLWKFYIDLAGQTGHANEALKFIEDTNARTDLSAGAQNRVRSVLYRGLLAVDRVDEGIAELRMLIRSEKSVPPQAPVANQPFVPGTSQQAMINRFLLQRQALENDPTEKIVKWDIELAQIGRLLKKDDLENEGFADAAQRVESLSATDADEEGLSVRTEVRDQLWTYEMETGRYPQAEKLVADEIVRLSEKAKTARTGTGRYDYQVRELLQKLALVYYEAGRWADVVTLLEKAPGWGVGDLVEIAESRTNLPRRSVPHLALIAARALAETGRVSEALPILDYTLREDSGDDAAYALLLKIGKGDLVARLDALYHQDQFEERPLIWKAVVLLQQGHAAEAEKACKAAIAVDPSDGEEGKGDRMRAYSVMADICDAEKQTQQAGFFRGVVKAIRMSEDADDFYDAGLLTHAVTMYDQALEIFSGAYCIQSRIARQLAELGRLQEAAVHYRKAFELMPVSFGRLESHCFGCERAFQGKTATGIAEETFTQMMAKDPKKPQLPYLLGYLYMEEKRFPEALANFQKATQLDPDYINAWRHIAEIGENYQLNPALRDEAVFNLLRLDPAGRHVTVQTDRVRQLDKLWNAEERAGKLIPPLPKTLFVLTASAAEVKPGMDALNPGFSPSLPGMTSDMQSSFKLQMLAMSVGRPFYHQRGESISPRDVVLGNRIIAAALDLL